MDKKGQQNAGVVIGLIYGVSFLVVAIIIAFLIVGSLGGSGSSGLIPQTSYPITNESSLTGALVSANTSGYDVNGTTYSFPGSFALVACWSEYNQSNGTAVNIPDSFGGYNVSLGADNCSISGAGNLSSAIPGTYNFPNVSVSYTFTADNSMNLAAGNLTSNFSRGVQNVSSRIPTVLLIAAIVLVIAILSVLVAVWQRMKIGSGGGL